jgi:hypothetical protein
MKIQRANYFYQVGLYANEMLMVAYFALEFVLLATFIRPRFYLFDSQCISGGLFFSFYLLYQVNRR